MNDSTRALRVASIPVEAGWAMRREMLSPRTRPVGGSYRVLADTPIVKRIPALASRNDYQPGWR